MPPQIIDVTPIVITPEDESKWGYQVASAIDETLAEFTRRGFMTFNNRFKDKEADTLIAAEGGIIERLKAAATPQEAVDIIVEKTTGSLPAQMVVSEFKSVVSNRLYAKNLDYDYALSDRTGGMGVS